MSSILVNTSVLHLKPGERKSAMQHLLLLGLSKYTETTGSQTIDMPALQRLHGTCRLSLYAHHSSFFCPPFFEFVPCFMAIRQHYVQTYMKIESLASSSVPWMRADAAARRMPACALRRTIATLPLVDCAKSLDTYDEDIFKCSWREVELGNMSRQ